MDEFKIERALAMSNYGVPVHEISFDLNDVVMEAATTNDRILAAIWVSFLPRNAEMTRKALKLAGESRVVALKTTFLLGGNPDPGTWDDETRAIADECFDVCEQHDLIFHFHTSPGGSSDISNFIPLVERYGKRCKIYLVHFGGGVSGHIRLVPKFLQWVEDGYKVYTDTSWAIGFGARWLLTEIEKHRRRRRPGVLRLGRAVVGLRLRVLEDQRHPQHLPGAQGAGLLAQLRGAVRRPWLTPALLDLDDRRLLVELQSLGVRVEDETRAGVRPTAAAAPGPSDAGFLWVRGLPLTVPMHAAYARDSPYTLRLTEHGPLLLRGDDDVGPVARARGGRASTTWRPPTASRTGRSRCCTSTRSPRPSCRSASTGTRPSSARSAASS